MTTNQETAVTRDYRSVNAEMRQAYDEWAEGVVRKDGALARITAGDYVGFLAGYRIARERYSRIPASDEAEEEPNGN